MNKEVQNLRNNLEKLKKPAQFCAGLLLLIFADPFGGLFFSLPGYHNATTDHHHNGGADTDNPLDHFIPSFALFFNFYRRFWA